jgi:SET domain
MHLFGSFEALYTLFALDNTHHVRRCNRETNHMNYVYYMGSAAIDSPVAENIVKGSNKYNDMLDWLMTQNDAFVSEKIEVKPSTVNGGGFGAFISHPVEVNELLFRVPRGACITLSDAFNDPKCGESLRKLVDKAGPGGNTVALAGYIATERLKNLNQNNDNIEVSRYGPYLATLPWERGVNNQEHILYWSDDEVETLLAGTMCYDEALDLRREVRLASNILETIISRPTTGSAFKFPWDRDADPPTPQDKLQEAVTAAFVCLLTRSFQDDGLGDNAGDEEKLVPLLDMLQHSEDPNVSHVMLKELHGCVEVRARRALDGGEELLNQYRSEMEENMPYHRVSIEKSSAKYRPFAKAKEYKSDTNHCHP